MPVLAQLCLIFGVCLASEGLVTLLPFPFPSAVLAMVILLLLLSTGLLKTEQIRASSNFLLDHMAFFFLPACVGILQYTEVLLENLWVILGICVLTVPLVYGVTGWTVQLAIRWMERRKERSHD